jgi:hypothetical protein
MAGLFDFSYDDPQAAGRLSFAAGLLDAAGPQTRPVSLGQALSQGLLGGQRAAQVAGESSRRNQLVDLQMQRIRQQQEEEQRARMMHEQQAAFLGQLPAQLNMPGGQGPTVAAAQQQGKLTPQMVATAMQLGIDPKRLESVISAPNIGRPEVKHWADVRNPDGSVSVTGFDQFGDPRNTGATPYKAPEFRDLGGSVVGIDPITMKPVTSFGKTMTPDARAVDSRARERLKFDQDQARQGGSKEKPPAGYRWKDDGSLEVIPGGPTDEKTKSAQIGKGTVSDVIASLRTMYDQLDQSGGITNPEKGTFANATAGVASSGVGQAAGRMFGTQNQSMRNTIAQQRPLLLQAIMKATGMSAKQMDSNAELKLYLATATDPQLDVSANRRALDMIETLYGVRTDGASPPAPAAPSSSEPKRIASDADYAALPSGSLFIAPDGSTRRKP